MKYTRRIFKTKFTGSQTLRELLQTMFVAEIIQFGDSIWIVSPWISDVVLIDNRSGNFDTLDHEWGRREVRLTDVLVTIMTFGTEVNIVTRGDQESSLTFVNNLSDVLKRRGLTNGLKFKFLNQLHTKGILLTNGLLIGSMNLTYSGLSMNDEYIEFCVEKEVISEARLEFESNYL